MTKSTELTWWQKAVFYQIYPRSFADGNGDGIGDLPGIIDRLDYLAHLGVDAIWLSPHYPSPQFDCGYDIADYTAVAPEYGTLADFQQLLDQVHRREMRLILDLVLNHTSDQHPWFLESRSSRDNPKRDWYVWQDGNQAVPGGQPNDWISTFGGSAWEYDQQTDQYYYHFFFKEQPDLNWRNPAVKAAMFDAVRFWLDMGVDGFRLDAISTIFEDPMLSNHGIGLSLVELRRLKEEAHSDAERQAADELWCKVFRYQEELPEVHDLMKELRLVVDEYDDRMLVGEAHQVAYHGNGYDELQLVFNFPLMWPERLSAPAVRQNQVERLTTLPAGAWPCNTLGNHDSDRVFSKYADGEHDDALARLSLVLMLTLKGTPFLYNGEEIGMVDLLLDDIDQFRDMLGTWAYGAIQRELGLSPQIALVLAAQNSRDKCRTPMQWGREANAGFCPAGVTPWLPVHPNHLAGVNVADQKEDPHSLFSFYRALLALRRNSPALIAGDYQSLQSDDDDLFVFVRRADEQSCLVAINFSSQPATLRADPQLPRVGKLLFGSLAARDRDVCDLADLQVAPYGFLVVQL